MKKLSVIVITAFLIGMSSKAATGPLQAQQTVDVKADYPSPRTHDPDA